MGGVEWRLVCIVVLPMLLLILLHASNGASNHAHQPVTRAHFPNQELGAYVPELERSVLGNLGKRDAVDAAQFADTQGMPQRAGAFAAREAEVRVDWTFQMGQVGAAGLTSAHRAYKCVVLICGFC